MSVPRDDTATAAAGKVRPLKIYYVIDYYDGPYAGTEKQLWLLIREMAARGHEVRLFVFRHTSYTRQAQDFPCPIELCDVSKMLSLNALLRMRELRQRVLRDKPDVVHAFFNDAAILVPIWCSTADTAVITSRRDLGFWYSKSILWGLRLANTRVSRIICNSEAVAGSLPNASDWTRQCWRSSSMRCRRKTCRRRQCRTSPAVPASPPPCRIRRT